MSAVLDLDAYRRRLTAEGEHAILCVCGAKNHITDVPPTHCRLCGGDLDSPASQHARAIARLGACVAYGIRARASVGGYCEVCDPPPVAAVHTEAQSARALAETCSGCGLCEPDHQRHCPTCCELGLPF